MNRPSRLLALAVSGAAALAAAPVLAQQPATETPGVPSGALLQMVLGLALILALLFAVAFILRRIGARQGFGGNGPLRIVGGQMLGTRERIVLVEVGDTWLVVGIAPGQLRTLHTMPKGELSTPPTGDSSFARVFRQIIDGKHEAR